MKGAIILAAGGSSRLGRPKQLLRWKNKTLITHVVDQMIQIGCDPVVVVLGAFREDIESALRASIKEPLHCISNPDWQRGQSTSLKVGIQHFLGCAAAHSAALVTLCDMPLISTDHYQALIDRVSARTPVVEDCPYRQAAQRDDAPLLAADRNRVSDLLASATRYQDGPGVPACFSPAALPTLVDSMGDRGARRWLRSTPPERVGLLDCPAALYDIDNQSDYLRAESLTHVRS
jgi:molybdenum cofactor cytidylyltransferase